MMTIIATRFKKTILFIGFVFFLNFSIVADDISDGIAQMLLEGFNSISIFIPDEKGEVHLTRTCDIAKKMQDIVSSKGKVRLTDMGKETERIAGLPPPDFLLGILTAEQPY